jgi:hypothetical protein
MTGHQPFNEICGMFGHAFFDCIVVHSLSRFFLHLCEFVICERNQMAGVKIFHNQQTGDDPAGEMARKMYSLLDEYQSKRMQNTRRAMIENARKGFNGSTPLFGFKTEEVPIAGNEV